MEDAGRTEGPRAFGLERRRGFDDDDGGVEEDDDVDDASSDDDAEVEALLFFFSRSLSGGLLLRFMLAFSVLVIAVLVIAVPSKTLTSIVGGMSTKNSRSWLSTYSSVAVSKGNLRSISR